MKYFGTDGFRGKVNEVLTIDHAVAIGKYLGYYFGQAQKEVNCVIGKDTRRSSYMYEYGLAAGLTSTGANVYLMHVTTTPSVAYVTKTGNFKFGIMITASHNPYCDNGIKIIDEDGYKMSEDVLQKIEDYIDGLTDIELATFEHIGKCQDYIHGRNEYINYLTRSMPFSLRGYHIGLDCSNGASFTIAKNVFDMLGAKTHVINADPDGYNINEKCGSTHIGTLVEYVKDNHWDVGFAFDGDADRCIAVDEKGNIIDGDMIIFMCGAYLKEQGRLVKDTVVSTVMSNLGFTKALEERGIKNVQTAVGDKYVSEELKANGYSVGGEQSGHIIFNQFATTGDGILTALKVMEVLVDKKCTLSSLFTDYKVYPQCLKNVKVGRPLDDVIADERVQTEIKAVEEELAGKGRVLLRKSGTEPLIRVMVEALDEEECIKETDRLCDVVKEAGRP